MRTRTNMRRTVVFSIVYTLLLFQTTRGDDDEGTDVIPNVGHHYPVHIGAENHIVQGRIKSDAGRGSLVASNVIVEGEFDANTHVHLRVEVRHSIYTRPHIYHPDITLDTSDPNNPQFQHPVIEFTNSTLPYGMEFAVVQSDAFYVNNDRFIAVRDFTNLGGRSSIHFYVVLKDTLSETQYVSNHLPFVVELEYQKRERTPEAALFAGVLILTIICIALLIPFVVRAKRRSKAGKPICGCGSADDSSETDSMNSNSDLAKNRAMPMEGKDNLALVLENAGIKHPSTGHDAHMTIQNRMMRSTSSFNLQPHWLDHHYSDVYDRPDYSHNQRNAQQVPVPGSGNNSKPQNNLQPTAPSYHNAVTLHVPNGNAGRAHTNTSSNDGKVAPSGFSRPVAPPSTRSSSSSSLFNSPVSFNMGTTPLNDHVNPTPVKSTETANIPVPPATNPTPEAKIDVPTTTVVVIHDDDQKESMAKSSPDLVLTSRSSDLRSLPSIQPPVAINFNGLSVDTDDSGVYSPSSSDIGSEAPSVSAQQSSKYEPSVLDERL